MNPGNTLLIQIQAPTIALTTEDGRLSLTLSGQWRSLNIAKKEEEIEKIINSLTTNQKIKIIFESNFLGDMAGSWLIGNLLYKIKKLGCMIDGDIPETITRHIQPEYRFESTPEPSGMMGFLIALGKQSHFIKELTLSLLNFFGEMITNLTTSIRSRNIRWVSVVHHLDVIGFRAIPLVSLISFLIGAVLAYQGINQLTRFGAAIFTVDLLAISLLRELAVLMTSIVIAGRSGSAFTAQIGTMALNQEIDAIRMLGLSPIRILVLPRVIGMVVALPLLVILSMVMGSIGGMVVCSFLIDLNAYDFFDSFQKSVSNSTFWVGFSKAPLFAIIISVIGCYRGMQVKGSAESVGNMTTQSVVESIFLIIVCDGLMSIYFSMLDL